MQRTVRNTTTNKVVIGELGRMYDSSPWVNCLDSNGDVKTSEQTYVDAYYLERAIEVRVESRKRHLQDTDWYIDREVDIANSYPAAIQTKRNDARAEINTIEALTTLAAVEAYSEGYS